MIYFIVNKFTLKKYRFVSHLPRIDLVLSIAAVSFFPIHKFITGRIVKWIVIVFCFLFDLIFGQKEFIWQVCCCYCCLFCTDCKFQLKLLISGFLSDTKNIVTNPKGFWNISNCLMQCNACCCNLKPWFFDKKPASIATN